MPKRALLDACVLFPAHLRDFLLRVATTGAFRPAWSDEILDEFVCSVLRRFPTLSPHNLARTRGLMEAGFAEARVEGHRGLVAELHLPDPDDRHVLAAAIAARAEVLVTFNLKDFPAGKVNKHGIAVLHPDAFVAQWVERDPGKVRQALARQVAAMRKPPVTEAVLLDVLARTGLPNSARRLRSLGESAS